MTQTQELDQSMGIAANCPTCGVARPSQPHDPLCEYADDTIVSTGEPASEPTVETEPEAGWVLKIVPEHKCITPAIDNQTFVGSIWKCGGCGQNWLVYERRGKNKGTKGLRRIAQDAAQKRREAAAQGETDPDEED